MYALKHAAIRRELATGSEYAEHRSALLRLAGHRNSVKSAP